MPIGLIRSSVMTSNVSLVYRLPCSGYITAPEYPRQKCDDHTKIDFRQRNLWELQSQAKVQDFRRCRLCELIITVQLTINFSPEKLTVFVHDGTTITRGNFCFRYFVCIQVYSMKAVIKHLNRYPSLH